ncbi:transposase (plasmid) [Halorubrum sp. CBA1229]|nr:transposase [Halorubrum sp. CBA1229]
MLHVQRNKCRRLQSGSKRGICGQLLPHKIREKNPDRPIIIVCDNFLSHFSEYINNIVEEIDMTRVALPRYSPDLNPIEQIWWSVNRDLSSLDARCRNVSNANL